MAIQISYILALLPLYVLVYLPLSRIIFPSQVPLSNNLAYNSSFIATEDAELFNPASCPKHSYETHILSLEPLMVYIENFLSVKEREHLVSIRSVSS
jgi:prolyl 4-hydroxylase